ncbi:hypothetical protein [Actinacidiphila sp. bgisy160]|uniref:hypothetical protein n=1 Tax=Actinacidiphila sp. bgisy160 TaxID=3413796 RepID=UPI003D71A5D9
MAHWEDGRPVGGDQSAIPELVSAVVGAGGVVLLSSFMQAVGTKLGEITAARMGGRGLWRRRGTTEEERTAAAFIAAVQKLGSVRREGGGVLRLEDEGSRTRVQVHPLLPVEAVAQFQRLDLRHPEVAGLEIAWTETLGDHPQGVWATTGGAEGAGTRYLWNDLRRTWEPHRRTP